jgi:RloB-like protein
MPKKQENSRGYSPRKVNTREPRQRFLIVCEGTKTEPNYFRGFRVPKNVVEIEIKGLGENPSNLVNSAQELSVQEEYDQIWCVFDRDDWPPEDFNNAIQNADRKDFKVAYSNEAFDLWYVLHFELLNTAIPRSDYTQKLSKHLGRKYQKNSETMYDELLSKQSVAIRNATNLLKQYASSNPGKDNPSTTVHLLVQELNKFI